MTTKRRLSARVLAVVFVLLVGCGPGTPIEPQTVPVAYVTAAGNLPPTFGPRFVDAARWVRGVLDGRWYEWASHLPDPNAPPPTRRRGRSDGRAGSHRGYATAKDCVRGWENGGDYGRSSNPTHFGFGQWDQPTWVEDGGNPDTWGTASPSEQESVFETGWSKGEAAQRQKWLKWDGC